MSPKILFGKKNRALLTELVRTDFKIRYQDSVLGYLWSLLKPLMMFVVLYVVFVNFLKIGSDIKNFPMYLLLGLMLWGFFNEMTNMCLTAVVGRGDLIRKIRIPRWMIIVSSSIAALINLALNGVVLAVFIVINKIEITPYILLLPLIILQLYIFTLGVSLFLSAAYVKYRDISYIWEVFMQAGFYATPILYPMSIIHSETIQKILLLNPLAQIIQDARFVLVNQSQTATTYKIFDGGYYMYIPFIITALVLLIGVLYFRKESKHFAENI